MNMELVKLISGHLVCNSTVVAKTFGFKHSELTKTIRKLNSDIEDLRGGCTPPYIKEIEQEYRGNKFKAFEMSREYFSLLAMRLKGKKALEWQINFNNAFYAMESALIKVNRNSKDNEWLKVRTQSKQLRLQQTDTIKEFTDYAIEQGSKSAKFYYKHITNATYKALGLIQHKKPKVRDSLDLMELSQLMVAENLAKKSLKKYMKQGEHYKVIYELVKQDLINFGDSLLITE